MHIWTQKCEKSLTQTLTVSVLSNLPYKCPCDCFHSSTTPSWFSTVQHNSSWDLCCLYVPFTLLSSWSASSLYLSLSIYVYLVHFRTFLLIYSLWAVFAHKRSVAAAVADPAGVQAKLKPINLSLCFRAAQHEPALSHSPQHTFNPFISPLITVSTFYAMYWATPLQSLNLGGFQSHCRSHAI